MTIPSFLEVCARVDQVFKESVGVTGQNNHDLALKHAGKVSALESRSWHSFIRVEAATHIPFHHFSVEKYEFLVNKGEHESAQPSSSSLRDMISGREGQADHDLFEPCKHLVGHPVFDALYSKDIVHSVEKIEPYIVIRLVIERHGNGVTSLPSLVRRKEQGFLSPDLFDWVSFNLLASAELSLPLETQDEAMEFETWVSSGDDNYFREQQKIDPIVYQIIYCMDQAGYRSISALIISAVAYMRAESRWTDCVKGFREDVAVKERALSFRPVRGVTVQHGEIVLRTVDWVTLFSLILLSVSLLTAAISLFGFIVGKYVLGSGCICISVTTFVAFFVSGLRLDIERRSGWFVCTRRKTVNILEAARIVRKHPSVLWTTALAQILSTWPENKAFLEVLWRRKSRLSDWIDASAKTVLTRDGQLALHLAENVLLILDECNALVLEQTAWDDWHERHFSYRRFLGEGEEDFNFSNMFFESGIGTLVDDDISHTPASGTHRLWKYCLSVSAKWRKSELYSKWYRPRRTSVYGLPIQDVGIEGIRREASYVERILATDRIPVVLPVRVDMHVREATANILSPCFEMADLNSPEVYEQLFDYEKVNKAKDYPFIYDENCLCLAISYKHHTGDFSNRMPRGVWKMEIPHIQQVLQFYGVRKVKFWTDTRLSKLYKSNILDWEKVGLAPYGQMHVYVVNSHLAETLVDRFWLTAERKLGMAIGGVHFAADDGKLVIVTAGIDDDIDAEVLTALNGVIASASVLGEVYRNDKLNVVQSSVATLKRVIGAEWKEIIISLPWSLMLSDISHDFAERQFDERDVTLEDNWNPAVDVLLSRRVLLETGEDVSFPTANVTTDLYLNTEEEDGKSYVAILRREEDETAAIDLRATKTSERLEISSIGKARLVGPEYLAQLEEAGLRKVEEVL